MLTRIRLRNFKKFEDADVVLDRPVVLIGPNNSGKTSVLQALALWELGLRLWLAKRGDEKVPKKRPGVTINRRDLISIPVPSANLLWRDLHVRNVERHIGKDGKQEQQTQNIRMELIVEGVTDGKEWRCGLEFDYANPESFYCRPLLQESGSRMTIPPEAGRVRVAYLPPMSGLADREFIKQPGEIGFLIGQGQTAQILRNLCFQVYQKEDKAQWRDIAEQIKLLFGAELRPPQYVKERSEITMEYRENGTQLDLSCAGRGLQQTLLLLAHLHANPGTILLLDEPDAHLEILRQRQIYHLLTDLADKQKSQLIAASHSEVVLTEAAGRGTVIAFVGKPHRLNDRGTQTLKALTDIGWDNYYQAEAKGWVLYLEDATDLAILQKFADTLGHAEAVKALERPFVHYICTNLPQRARDHFFGLREGKADLAGLALFDRLDKELQTTSPLVELMWSRREIENYFCTEQVLLAYARHDIPDDLFGSGEKAEREAAMAGSIRGVAEALQTLGKPDPWSPDIKASDEFLDPVLRKYFSRLKLPLLLRKADYYRLAAFVPKDSIPKEVSEKLDAIVQVAARAKPA